MAFATQRALRAARALAGGSVAGAVVAGALLVRSQPHAASQEAAAPAARVSKQRVQGQFTLKSVARCHSAKLNPREVNDRVQDDCGEDAYFLSVPTTGAAVSVGVADGVGGWAEAGVDPALFAWELMNCCKDVAVEAAYEMNTLFPKKVLIEGYGRLLEASKPPIGSATACVASLDRSTGELHVANLGDSGALLFRQQEEGEGECVLESQAQQHHFNCPYQLMVAPEDYGDADPPTAADTYTVSTLPGDVLVLVTDGFLDNISTKQTVDVIKQMHGAELSTIADSLLELAVGRSKSKKATPFSRAAKKAGFKFKGGKLDDITVVVARMERSE